jgi:hypothetical protein
MRMVIYLRIPTLLYRGKNYVCQPLKNVALMTLGRQMHITESLVPEPSCFEFEVAVEKLQRQKSPGIDHNPAGLVQEGGNTLLLRSTDLLIMFVTRNNFHSNGRHLL